MNRRGVCYDVGHVMGINWRPVFDMAVVHRELEIIHGDLHCNAVRIGGRDLKRVVRASEDALAQGLEVWFSPVLWDKSPGQTFAYIVAAAEAAEKLRLRRPDRLVFVVGSELTLFMQGIVPGKSLVARMRNLGTMVDFTLGLHSLPLVGRLVRPRLNGVYVRDEELQARELAETLAILDAAGVDGAFVSTFLSAIHPYDEDPRYDLDMAASTLVKTLGRGRHGTTYPDVPWEPKASFWAVADYYTRQS